MMLGLTKDLFTGKVTARARERTTIARFLTELQAKIPPPTTP